MPRRETRRPIDWRGSLTPEAREAGEQYKRETARYWAWDNDPYYVPALPDVERKHEP